MPKSPRNSPIPSNKPLAARKLHEKADRLLERSAKSIKAQPEVIKETKKTQALGRDSKQFKVLALLHSPEGATVDEMAQVTGWQRHSVHGMMSGVLKKRLGLSITSSKEVRGRVYRIVTSPSRS